MSEIKTRIDFGEVSKLMSLATAIVNEWPTNTNILSVVQARIKEIEAQAADEVKEQKIETAVPGGMPADTVAHTAALEPSEAVDEDGDGGIDEDDKPKPVVRRAAPTAADAAHIPGRRV